MTWQRRIQDFTCGDEVAFSAQYLRNTGQYTGDIPFARGKIVALIHSGETTRAEVDWNDPEVPRRVNVANICRVRSREFCD